MESALIVSKTDKSTAFFKSFLTFSSIPRIFTLQTCGEARRFLLERAVDLVIINAPLQDETGEDLSRYIAGNGTAQVILVVKNEHFYAIAAACENDGVLTIPKPINNSILWSALSLAKSTQNILKRMRDENAKLKQKIEDIRIIDYAKIILATNMNMQEKEAHRYIEKQAMDLRLTRKAVAENIVKTYEDL